MSTNADEVASQTASPDDVRSALETIQGSSDPDVIPPGGTQATTTKEAQEEARKILKRIGRHEGETEEISKNIEASAERSKAALKNAQQLLLQYGGPGGPLWPSEHEKALQIEAAAAQTPGAGVHGALWAAQGNMAKVQAEQEAAQREALMRYLQTYSGADLAEKLRGIDTQTAEGKRKLLEIMQRQDTELGKAAMTALGRMATTPAQQAGMKPQSNFGKIALDALGPRAYMTPGDPGSGFSPAYRAMVKQLNDAAVAEARARAGIDEVPLTPEEKLENANLAGVPFNPVGMPDTAHMSTKQRTNFYNSEQKAAEKQFADYGANDEQMMKALRNLDEFQELNNHTYTGPMIAPVRIGGVHAGPHGAGAELGTEGGINVWPPSIFAHMQSSVQTMDKLAADTVAQAIPSKGFGRVTNRDLGLFQSAMIGTDKPKATNDAIAEALRITLQNNLQRHQFEQAYFGLHRTLSGATQAWDTYLNDNPIFDHSAPFLKNGLKPLNPRRLDWKSYFKNQNPQIEVEQGGEGPPGTQEPDVSYHPQASDTQPAGMAEGGEVGDKADPEVRSSLDALINGLTLKAAGRPEDPDSPGSNLGMELLGGAGTTAAALAALRRPAAAARFMAAHPHLTATGIGTVAGGLSGELGGGDPMVGAATGASLGPLLSMAGRGASAPLLRLTNELTRSAGPGVRKSLEAINLDRPGGPREIADILAKDARMGVQSTVAEAAGPRSVGLTSAAIRKDVPESNALLGALQERQAGSPMAVGENVNQGLKPDDYYAKTEELRNNLYTKAAPLYDQAFSQFPSVKTQSLMQILNTPSGQEAAARAFRMMQDQRLPIGAPDVTGMVQNPSLQYLDQIKRALDDMIIREEGSGANYQATQQGRVLRQMRSQLVDELDKATTGPNGRSPYREARDQYAGDLDIMDALRGGRETFDKMTPQEVKDLMGKLDWSARDAYRTGVAEGIMQRIGSMGANRNTAQAVIANPNLQAKIMAIFDNPREGQQFLTALQRQADVFGTGQKLVRAGEAGLHMSQQPLSIGQMVRGMLMSPGKASGISETMGTMANDPHAKEKMTRLQSTADALRAQKGVSQLIGGATAGGGAAALAPTPQQGQ